MRAPAVDGTDAVAAAISSSRLGMDDGDAPTVILARADLFADSLSSGPVQGALGAPLLLTPPNAADDRVASELDRLGATSVVVFGGDAAGVQTYGREVADTVEGATRLETAVDAAATYHPAATQALIVRAFAAEGEDQTRAFADSLAAGVAGSFLGQPVLLTERERLSDATRAYLASSQIRTVMIVGGSGAVSEQVRTDLEALGITVERASGTNRFGTAATLGVGAANAGRRPVKAALYVEGQAPDAWATGFSLAYLGTHGGLVLLTSGEILPVESTFAALLPGLSHVCAATTAEAACARVDAALASGPFFRDPDAYSLLDGEQEVPPSGAEGVSASAAILGSTASDTLCYSISLYDIVPSAAHIHRGAAGANGPVVVPLTTFRFEPLAIVACALDVDPALVREIIDDPGAFYVNLHTEAHPDGAIRGQLFPISRYAFADLSGDAEVGEGMPDAGGFSSAIATTRPDELCSELFVDMSEPAVAAHIHSGAEDTNGPVVVTLPTPNVNGGVAGCVDGLDPGVVDDILTNPSDYYINVHTASFPDGAIRGQLAAPEAPPEG